MAGLPHRPRNELMGTELFVLNAAEWLTSSLDTIPQALVQVSLP
jgi:hypothetical protein